MHSSVRLDSSISVSKRMEVIGNRLNSLGYFTKNRENKFNFSERSVLYGGRFAYSYLVFGVSRRGVIAFKNNEIICKFPLFTQFIGLLTLVTVLASTFVNIGDSSLLYVGISSLLLFTILFTIVRTKNLKVAKGLLRKLTGIQ